MSAEFRQVAIRGERGRSERLFRAAVSAFCSLTRPSKRERAQLDDLALPLFDNVSAEGRRFAAAALSECRDAPPLLVRRLAEEPVATAAPLLVRSPALTDADLIRLIGRHGLPHARAIARRARLNPAIGSLLDALKDPEIRRLRGMKPELTVVADRGGEKLRETRERLRAMMLPADATVAAPPNRRMAWGEIFPRLLETALAGHPPLFQTALADALGLEFAAARAIAGPHGHADLLVALRALDLREEQAFLLTAALYPASFAGPGAIRLFLSRYRQLDRESAERRVEEWRPETAAAAASPAAAANGSAAPIRQAS